MEPRQKIEPVHKQVELYGKMVDENIADLLNLLWHSGYETQYSCQGGHGRFGDYLNRGYIVFDRFAQGMQFHTETMLMLVESVPDYFDHSLSERNKLGHNVLSDARLRLEAGDPTSGGVRGVVDFAPRFLGRITELWTARCA